MTTGKILFVAPSAYPLGGVAVWLDYLLSGLSSHGWGVCLGLVNGRFHRADIYQSMHPFEKVVYIDNDTGTQYGRVNALKQSIKRCSADIVVSINIPDVYEAVTQLKEKGMNIKSVMTLHGLEHDSFTDIKQFRSQIDALIVTNKLTKAMAVNYSGFEAQRAFYAPYGVHVPKVSFQSKHHLSPVVIAYVGRIDEGQKRCQDLVELVRQLEYSKIKFELKLVGDGPYQEELIKRLNEECNTGKISYSGQVSNKQLVENVFTSIDVLILTSDWETGPIVIWEAMAAGVVVLSSKYIGSGLEASLVDGDNCMMFDIADMQSAVIKLKQIISDDNYAKLQGNALSLVESKYSRAHSISEWDNAFKKIHQEVTTKPARSKMNNWSKNGKIEKLFGHKIGNYVRAVMNKRAYIKNAGAEWPHSYSAVSKEADAEIYDLMRRLDKKEQVS